MAAVDDAVQTRVHERLFGSLAILSETHLKVGLLDHVAVLVFMIMRRRHTVSHSGRAVPVLPTASRLTTSSPTPAGLVCSVSIAATVMGLRWYLAVLMCSCLTVSDPERLIMGR